MNRPSNRALISGLAAAVVLTGVYFGFRSFRSPNAAKQPNSLCAEPITIGTETWPGYLPLYVAEANGYFRDEGLQVHIKRYVALGDLSKDYVAGKMQARANLTLEAVNEFNQGFDHRAVLVIDYSSGSDAILASNGIRSVKDFAGKRVGYEPNTLEEFFLYWALNQYGLSMRDIIAVPGNQEMRIAQFESGKIDVGVTHEPFLSKVLKGGKARVVYSSLDAPGLITDILTIRTDFLESHPEAVHGILRAYFRGLDFWKTHPEEARAILAKEFGDTPESVRTQMKGITMLDLKDNRTAFTFAMGLQSLYGNMRRIGVFVLNHRSAADMKLALQTDRLIDARSVRKLFKENQSAVQP